MNVLFSEIVNTAVEGGKEVDQTWFYLLMIFPIPRANLVNQVNM